MHQRVKFLSKCMRVISTFYIVVILFQYMLPTYVFMLILVDPMMYTYIWLGIYNNYIGATH
jgi:hypothetical protein